MFFSSLMARGSSAVGGSIAMNASIWKQVGDDHVAVGAGRLVEAARARPGRASRATSIWTWSMKLRFQIGSNRPLAKRKREDVLRRLLAEEVVDAEDLLLVEDLVHGALSARALARSVPNGFSMITRERSTEPASREHG